MKKRKIYKFPEFKKAFKTAKFPENLENKQISVELKEVNKIFQRQTLDSRLSPIEIEYLWTAFYGDGSTIDCLFENDTVIFCDAIIHPFVRIFHIPSMRCFTDNFWLQMQEEQIGFNPDRFSEYMREYIPLPFVAINQFNDYLVGGGNTLPECIRSLGRYVKTEDPMLVTRL